jgi:hypothetical protein
MASLKRCRDTKREFFNTLENAARIQRLKTGESLGGEPNPLTDIKI